MLPCKTVIKTGPGWVCQPLKPPTANVTHRDVRLFTAEAEGEQVNDVLRVIALHGATASDTTLMIRRLDALLVGVRAMGGNSGPATEAG